MCPPKKFNRAPGALERDAAGELTHPRLSGYSLRLSTLPFDARYRGVISVTGKIPVAQENLEAALLFAHIFFLSRPKLLDHFPLVGILRRRQRGVLEPDGDAIIPV